jgi:hypothetical protein
MQCQRAALCDSQWCGWHEFYVVCGRKVIFLHGVGMGCIARRAGTAFPRGAWERVEVMSFFQSVLYIVIQNQKLYSQ